MRILFATLLLLSGPVCADTPEEDFAAAVTAYSDAKALGHESETFLHAREAWKIGQGLFADDPAAQAILTFRYGEAAAAVREREALGLLEDSITLYEVAEGKDSDALIAPMLAAANEALSRKQNEKAYDYFRDVLARTRKAWPDGSVAEARARTGIGRLYLEAADRKRAVPYLSDACILHDRFGTEETWRDKAEAYYWRGQAGRDDYSPTTARIAFETALSTYLAHAPNDRRVLTLHKRLVEVGHKLADTALATAHTLAAARFSVGTQGDPIYDPMGILYAPDKGGKPASILVAYRLDATGRAQDINILKTAGISPEKAHNIVAGTYFAPKLENGEPVPTGRIEIEYGVTVPYEPGS